MTENIKSLEQQIRAAADLAIEQIKEQAAEERAALFAEHEAKMAAICAQEQKNRRLQEAEMEKLRASMKAMLEEFGS